MPFSIWEYLRQRTRDSVLAGIQDAFDIAEQGDTNGSQHDQAQRLLAKLGGTPADADVPRQLPSASMNGHAEATASPVPAEAPPQKPPQRPQDASAFDADLESRLNAAAAQQAEPSPQTGNRRQWKDTDPPVIRKRGRGRPRKEDAS